jgi:hypothetical protein
MECPHCRGPVLTSKRKVLGLSLFYCKACERKNVEGSPHWPTTGPGHEKQLEEFALEVATQNKRWRMFMSGELDHTGFCDVNMMGE